MAKASTTPVEKRFIDIDTSNEVGRQAAAWSWTDDFAVDVEPPAAPASSHALPFQGLFVAMLPHALAGKKPSKPVALSFFVERSTEPAKMNISKAQGRVRDQFNKWLKTLPADQAEVLTISFAQKSGKESDARITGVPHLVFWLLTSKPYTPPVAEQQQAPETEQQEQPAEQQEAA